ncbi:MAG: hypothetical protein NC483_01435 [Ruminococcus sp.]|nr:hypothetical protein [Ruminococcus sp.]
MHSFYINDKGRVFKLIDEKRGTYYQLTSAEAQDFLDKVGKAAINNVAFNNNTLQLTYENDRVTIEGEYLDKKTPFALEVRNRMLELKEEKERQSIADFKKRFNGYIPPINRGKCIKFGSLIVAGAISLHLTIPMVVAYFSKKEQEKYLNDAEPSQSIGMLVEDETYEKFKTDVIDTTIYAELAFDDMTDRAINSAGESQLDVVTRNCSSYLDKYIDRYGLPSNIMYAICTLEKGILDSHLENDEVDNPMQLNGMSGEYFSNIPVYSNGVLTGEYDSFYAFSKDDPRIAEHPNDKILIIENVEDNFQISCAQTRRCIDRYKDVFIVIDSYNKGLYAFTNLYDNPLIEVPHDLEYYKNNFNDFSWTTLIQEYYKVKTGDPTYVYGDPNYLWNVLKHVDMGDSSSVMIRYYYQGELIEVSLTNTNKLDNSVFDEYNNSLGR